METELNFLTLNITNRLTDVWSKYENNEYSKFGPLMPEKSIKNVVTFLSLNPSLPPQFLKSAKEDGMKATSYPFTDFRNKEKPYPFFKKFYQIGNEINEPWTSIDLLYIRDSDQENILKMYKNMEARNFIYEQVQITLDLLVEMEPKLVIVSNSLVENILLNYSFNENAKLDENNIYRFKNIPFIMNESKFIGSRQHWNSTSKEHLKEKMYNEIRRVIQILN